MPLFDNRQNDRNFKPKKPAAIALNWPTRALCVALIAGILALGIAPARIINSISTSVASVNAPLRAASVASTVR